MYLHLVCGDHMPQVMFELLHSHVPAHEQCFICNIGHMHACIVYTCMLYCSSHWEHILISFFNYVSRLIEVERYLCWDSEIGSPMQGIKQRNMMTLQWSIYLMCFSSLLHALLFTRSCMSGTGAGILGFSLHSQAVCTCLVSHQYHLTFHHVEYVLLTEISI